MKVMTIVGTRPEIIKLASTIKELDKYTEHILVHTGQNYDYELNQVFFKDLGLREKIQSMILFIKHNNQIEFPVKPHTKISLGDIVTIMCPDFCLGNAIKFFTDQSFSNVAKKETKKLQKQVRIKNKISNKTKRKGK